MLPFTFPEFPPQVVLVSPEPVMRQLVYIGHYGKPRFDGDCGDGSIDYPFKTILDSFTHEVSNG